MKLPLVALLLLTSFGLPPEPTILPAHSHNDYEHDTPLLLALEHRFQSVEADVWLIDGELRVSHTRPLIPSRAPTLEELYLVPLKLMVLANEGKVYPEYGGDFFLMIDVKGPAEETFEVLSKQIAAYPELQESVTFVVSGNRAIRQLLNQEDQLLTLDGRLDQLGDQISADNMPFISDNFRTYFQWKGGDISATDIQRLDAMAEQVHDQGKLFRLWATPDTPECWEFLLDHGVDLINTDQIEAFSEWMRGR